MERCLAPSWEVRLVRSRRRRRARRHHVHGACRATELAVFASPSLCFFSLFSFSVIPYFARELDPLNLWVECKIRRNETGRRPQHGKILLIVVFIPIFSSLGKNKVRLVSFFNFICCIVFFLSLFFFSVTSGRAQYGRTGREGVRRGGVAQRGEGTSGGVTKTEQSADEEG